MQLSIPERRTEMANITQAIRWRRDSESALCFAWEPWGRLTMDEICLLGVGFADLSKVVSCAFAGNRFSIHPDESGPPPSSG
jgi:hypothetical protein